MIEIYNKEDDTKFIKEKLKELRQQRERLKAKNKIEHIKYVNEIIALYEKQLEIMGQKSE